MGASNNVQVYPQFFKVYEPQYSSEAMMLPPTIEARISAKIPDRVLLRNRFGKIWLIDVRKHEGEEGLYFEGGGWCKFVVENSLEFGDFMVFYYNGGRIFDVVLLAKDGCEKQPNHLLPDP
ncbi:hypothetical protein RDABS01_019882 [Bienertia sinuspersici]